MKTPQDPLLFDSNETRNKSRRKHFRTYRQTLKHTRSVLHPSPPPSKTLFHTGVVLLFALYIGSAPFQAYAALQPSLVIFESGVLGYLAIEIILALWTGSPSKIEYLFSTLNFANVIVLLALAFGLALDLGFVPSDQTTRMALELSLRSLVCFKFWQIFALLDSNSAKNLTAVRKKLQMPDNTVIEKVIFHHPVVLLPYFFVGTLLLMFAPWTLLVFHDMVIRGLLLLLIFIIIWLLLDRVRIHHINGGYIAKGKLCNVKTHWLSGDATEDIPLVDIGPMRTSDRGVFRAWCNMGSFKFNTVENTSHALDHISEPQKARCKLEEEIKKAKRQEQLDNAFVNEVFKNIFSSDKNVIAAFLQLFKKYPNLPFHEIVQKNLLQESELTELPYRLLETPNDERMSPAESGGGKNRPLPAVTR